MVCEICKRGPQHGITVYRANPKGQIGIWRCAEHPCTESINSQMETLDIVEILDPIHIGHTIKGIM